MSKAKKRGKQVRSSQAAKAAAAQKRLQQRQAKAKRSRDDAAAARLSTAGLARAFLDTGIPASQAQVPPPPSLADPSAARSASQLHQA